MRHKTVGEGVQRLDIHQKVQGSRKYPQDFSMEGQLYAKVVWSAHPHAIVKKVDIAAAEAAPGVVKVLTYEDVPVNEYGINIADQHVLAPEGGKVRWVGDRIAIVVAETQAQAERAAELVQVEYEPLPVVTDPRQAMQLGAPLVHEDRESNILHHIPIRRGDVEQGFAQADVIVESYYTTHYVEHAYMQPDAALGYIDDQGRVTVISACQWPHDDLHQIAHMLDLPEDSLREIVPSVGGAFGGREDMHIQHLAALCAFVLRRPVKIIFDREEVTQRTGKRHPFYLRHRTGATRDGQLVAAEVEVISDAGAYASTSIIVLNNAATFALGPYKVPNARIDAYTVHTNNAVTMAMRGFGATQPPMGYESQMDKLAEALGMDPVELRMKNLLEPGDIAVTGNVMTEETGVKETLHQAALAAGWRQEGERWVKPELGAPSAPHKGRGIGVAIGYKNVGFSLGFDDKSSAHVELTLAESGEIARVLVKIASVEVGQGVLTALAQIAADTLGVDLSRVRLAYLDTANVPDAGSSSASRHVFVSGGAVHRACLAAREKWEAVLRAETGETHVETEYTFRGRSVRATTPFAPETGQCEPHISYSYATQIALVEVDTETGETDILHFWAVADAGKVVNPPMYFGQQAGGVHMGVGYALTEHYIQQDGRPRTRRFSEYHIPTVLDMPHQFQSIAVESAPDPNGPFGATGLGETPTLPTAPAITNAIHDAVGVWIDDLPANAERVWWALQAHARKELIAL
jgi:CO/xanthine dehydrogenase Mo-binding subunit